jgi:hypothetical protein
MNDDLRPDAFDEELSRRFGAGAGAPAEADPDVVLDAMRPRLQQARTRRRASLASAIAGVAVVVVVLAFVLGGGGGGGGSVRTPPASNSPGTPTTTSSTPSTTAPTGGSATPDTVHGREQEQASATTPSVPDATPPATSPSDTTPPDATSIVQAWANSDGGSIGYEFVDGRISLAGVTAAPGYTAQVQDNGPTRVEVRFSNGQTEWRIRVDVDNGVLQQPEITQHGG